MPAELIRHQLEQRLLHFLGIHEARFQKLRKEGDPEGVAWYVEDFLVVVVKPGHTKYLKIGQPVAGPYANGGWGGVAVKYRDGTYEDYAWTDRFDGLPRADWRSVFKQVLTEEQKALMRNFEPELDELLVTSSGRK